MFAGIFRTLRVSTFSLTLQTSLFPKSAPHCNNKRAQERTARDRGTAPEGVMVGESWGGEQRHQGGGRGERHDQGNGKVPAHIHGRYHPRSDRHGVGAKGASTIVRDRLQKGFFQLAAATRGLHRAPLDLVGSNSTNLLAQGQDQTVGARSLKVCLWLQSEVPECADLRPVLTLKPTSAPRR